jgi:predicted permease
LAIQVTDNFFAITGIPVALGRPPRPGETDAVILSYGLSERRMGSDPDAIGRKMILDGRLYRITGVLPRDHRTLFGFGFSPDLYMPLSNEATYLSLYSRLPAGMTRAVARARLEAACRVFDGPNPPARHRRARDISVTAVSGLDRIRTDSALAAIAAFFAMLMMVVGLVLLIACANVASLLLARTASRSHELAVRLSIGAGRGRLVRQLLTESLLLALCGTSAGLALNLALTSAVSRIRLVLPVPIQLRIEPDWRLLAYSTALAIASSLAAGLLPALQTTRAGISAALKREESQVSSRWTLRNTLVVGQLAVSIVLLCTGLLFVRNLVRASTTDPGFDIHHTVWATMRLVPVSDDPAKIDAMAATALERIRALPGVDSAALVRVVPLNDNMTIGMPVHTDLSAEPVQAMFRFNNVGPDYIRVMRIPILRGREFLPGDRAGAQPVAIINENMALRLFGSVDPIGHIITWEGPPVRIVGVAKNSKYFTLGERNMLAYYSPYAQWQRPLHHSNSRPDLNFLIRATGRPEALIAPLNAALGGLDKTTAIEIKPMSQALVFALLPSRFGAAIAGSIGLLGLALAAIGLYGVLLYSVSRRIREIGLRVALGAAPRNVFLLVLRKSAALGAVGISIGLALAVFAVRPLAMFLTPEIRTGDPANFAAVAAILLGVAVAATVGPVLRALHVDPITALRHE